MRTLSDNIFRRYEKKYLLTDSQRELLFSRINEYLIPDRFAHSTVCNIYFDTENSDLIVKSIEKPIYKEKLRLRSYSTPKMEDEVFLEIKSKHDGIVGKRRVILSLKDFYHYLNDHQFDTDNQIMKEIDYFFQYYDLMPAIYIAYDRESFVGKEEPDLRITLDSNLRYRYDDLKIEDGDHGRLYFDKPTYIMEIKTLGGMPLWLVHALSDLKIYPSSFSKYGKIYIKGENEKC